MSQGTQKRKLSPAEVRARQSAWARAHLKPWTKKGGENPPPKSPGPPKKKLIVERLEELLLANDGKEATALAKSLIRAGKQSYRACDIIIRNTQGLPTARVEIAGPGNFPISIQLLDQIVGGGEETGE